MESYTQNNKGSKHIQTLHMIYYQALNDYYLSKHI